MARALFVLVLSLVAGGIGHANHLNAITELATLGVIASLVMLALAAWRHTRGRRSSTPEA